MDKNNNYKAKQIFIRFLKNNKAYIRFIRNITEKGEGVDINYLVEKIKPCYWIDEAFYWMDTLEGRPYWSNMERTWMEYLKDNLKEETYA